MAPINPAVLLTTSSGRSILLRILALSGDVVQLTVGHWQNLLLLILISQIPLVAARAAAVTRTWTKVDSGNFRLYTTGTARQVVPLLERLELAHAFFLESGIAAPAKDGKPLRIVAFADAQDYFQYQPKAGAAAFFQPGREADYILLQGLGPQYERIVTHEYVHYVFRHSYPRYRCGCRKAWLTSIPPLNCEMKPTDDTFPLGSACQSAVGIRVTQRTLT